MTVVDSTVIEDPVIVEFLNTNNPSIFTDRYMRPANGGYYVYPGARRHDSYLAAWTKAGKPKSIVAQTAGIPFEVEPEIKDDGTVIFFERRGYIFLPWQTEFFQDTRTDKTIIGLTGTGKTQSIGVMACVLAATTPHFRFLNVAPTIYQSNLMVRTIEETIQGTDYLTKFLPTGKHGHGYAKEKPYTTYLFENGSSMEFMNVQKHAANIQSWYGDWINVDEAGLLWNTDESGMTQLASIMVGLATRMRATRPDGKPRLGWLSLISLGYDNDTLWERFDLGEAEATKAFYYSRKVMHKDNPYLRPEDITRIMRNVPKHLEGQYMRGERPPRSGAYFHPSVLEPMFSERQMEEAIKSGAKIITDKCGIVEYEEKPDPTHIYLMAGDPGTGEPPNRNTPTIVVFDITEFPEAPAKLVGFWWGFGNGSYKPFIYKFEEWMGKYKVPTMFRGYDSTASQKMLAELVWESGGKEVQPLGFDGSKKWQYLTSMLLLMSHGKLQIPAGIEGIRVQTKNYIIPDKKIAQDIVASLSMACMLMVPLYHSLYPDDEKDQKDGSSSIAGISRENRPTYERNSVRTSTRRQANVLPRRR